MEKDRLIKVIQDGKVRMKQTYVATKDSKKEQQRLDDYIKMLQKSTADLGEQRNLAQKESNIQDKAVKEAKILAIEAEKNAAAADQKL